ncbi:MAG TPA: hypothetical protein VKZ18_13185 [Polyangia bacterium]|nr:hypothetical protein [Polyangia bacterium]
MDDAAEAHRAAVIAALLGVVGTAMGVVGFWRVSDPALRAVQVGGILVNGTILLTLRGRHPPYSRRQADALFLLLLVPTVVMAWMVDAARAAHGLRWVPYEPAKLSVLTLAVIAPPGWATGAGAIAMFVGSSLIHHALLGDAVRARMSAGEPFAIIAYGVFALVLLGFKQRSYALRLELSRARAEKVAIERVARVAMALRDLANTPVQTLELIRQQLLAEGLQRRAQTDRMGRALERLRRLNDLLGPYQAAVIWDDEGRTLEREIRTVSRASRHRVELAPRRL